MNEAAIQDPIYAFKRLIVIVCALLELMFSPDYDGTVPSALQRMIDEFRASLRANRIAASNTGITAPSRLRCDASAPMQTSRRTTTARVHFTTMQSHHTTAACTNRPHPPSNRLKTRQIPVLKHA